MTLAIVLPIATKSLTGGILSLVVPLGVLVVVAIWYVVFVRRGSGEA
jgi:hypothetical protein